MTEKEKEAAVLLDYAESIGMRSAIGQSLVGEIILMVVSSTWPKIALAIVGSYSDQLIIFSKCTNVFDPDTLERMFRGDYSVRSLSSELGTCSKNVIVPVGAIGWMQKLSDSRFWQTSSVASDLQQWKGDK